MAAIFQHYLKLLVLKSAPQNLPASSVLLKVLLLLYCLFAMMTAAEANNTLHSMIHSVANLGMLLAFVMLLLRDEKPRINQTLNAFIGAELLISIVQRMYALVFSIGSNDQELPGIAWFFLLVIFIWIVVVFAHIIRHAADINMASASTISIAYVILNIMTLASIAGYLKA